ncbi:hypothetical protein VB776_04210 [Arcicella sp. DC2W]|uniref:Uncharacterized protein n=1 Tax=Arcicella gelida TaxID=2984195 RepID=A0ABU5S0Z0_9BACT|nr:hypothetical protein [Arcicella sp. DC2W]MEA5402105.1 hypothetical protein [Arcicella sp. DC2W]
MEAVDMFIKLIAKYENKAKQDVEINIISYLNKYRRANRSAEVAKQTLMPIADEFANQNYYPSFLSDLVKEIETGVPMVRTTYRVFLMLEYIGESSHLKRYMLGSQSDVKSDLLVGSYWYMYSHEYYFSKTPEQKVMFITRDMVFFNQFSYATVLATKNHGGETVGMQHYSGHYYTKNNRYLFLDLHISETREKDLRVIIDIGTGNSNIGEVFTGYYMNASNNLYFGPILFERIPAQEKLFARSFEEHDSSLNRSVWEYFNGLNSMPYEILPTYSSKGRIGKFLDM